VSELSEMHIIVTGAASGIGRSTCEWLVARGAHVLAADLRQESVDAAVAEMNQLDGPKVIGRVCDVREAADCDALVEAAISAWDKIDALVHCAGVLRPPGGRPAPLHELSDEEYDFVVGTNLRGTFLVNRAVLRQMVSQKSGQVINLSSTSGRRGRPLDSIYSASKAGVIGLSESIAEEVRPFGIRVQVLLPDAVATPLWKQNGPLPPPPGSLPPERVAELIGFCLSLPADAYCENLIIAPLQTRRMRSRRKRKDDE